MLNELYEVYVEVVDHLEELEKRMTALEELHENTLENMDVDTRFKH